MKKSLLAFVAVLCYMMAATVFTACGKDDDKTDSGGSTQKQVVSIYYEFTVGQAYLDFYDVYCIYTDANGVVQNEKCTSAANYYKQSVDYDKAPSSYEFSVIGIPKDPLPEIDPDASYDVSHSYVTSVCVKPSADSDKTTKIIMGSSNTSTRQTKGSALKEAIAKGQREIVMKQTGTK